MDSFGFSLGAPHFTVESIVVLIRIHISPRPFPSFGAALTASGDAQLHDQISKITIFLPMKSMQTVSKFSFFKFQWKSLIQSINPQNPNCSRRPAPKNWSSPATCCHQPNSVSTRCTSTVRDLGRWTRWSPLEIRENDGFHQQKSEGIHDDFTGKIMCFEHI